LSKAFKLPAFYFLPFISCKLSLPPFGRDVVGIRCESCRFCTSRLVFYGLRATCSVLLEVPIGCCLQCKRKWEEEPHGPFLSNL